MIKPPKIKKGRMFKKKWLGRCFVCGLDDGSAKGLVEIRDQIFRGDDEVLNCCVDHGKEEISKAIKNRGEE